MITKGFAAGLGRRPWPRGRRFDINGNVSLVRAARAAAPAGDGIEADLGHIEGNEGIATAIAVGKLTDSDAAKTFFRGL